MRVRCGQPSEGDEDVQGQVDGEIYCSSVFKVHDCEAHDDAFGLWECGQLYSMIAIYILQ